MKRGKKDYSPFSEKEIIGVNEEKTGTLTTSITTDNLIMACDVKASKADQRLIYNKERRLLLQSRRPTAAGNHSQQGSDDTAGRVSSHGSPPWSNARGFDLPRAHQKPNRKR